MTRILTGADSFADDALTGFADLFSNYVAVVSGGVIRRNPGGAGKVAVVVGGGSGHYPAFAGYVGHGLADGAAIGDIFSSPSAGRVTSVAAAAQSGSGVLLGFGNYAGDNLSFRAAVTQLAARGIEARCIAVTDDVASAPAGVPSQRRGVAGDLIVFKIAGAAAEQMLSLDEVERIALKANSATRSIGIGFSGCTLPGQNRPLFTVEPGMMEIGLGIHGEAGIHETKVMDGEKLATEMLSHLLAERPVEASGRVAVLLNGLGATKYEEMFVLWRYLASLMKDHELDLVAPLAGEYVTSLDMAGCSLTICWLDSELEALWCADVDTPSMRRPDVSGNLDVKPKSISPTDAIIPVCEETEYTVPPVNEQATLVVHLFGSVAECLAAAESRLGDLDAVAGDGDHGSGMARGSRAASAAAAHACDLGKPASVVLSEAAAAWADRSGGTAGALWGAGLASIAESLANNASAAETAQAALAKVMSFGGAVAGDKTMVDAIEPFVNIFVERTANGDELATAWRAAADAATLAADKTSELAARLGRARTLANRSTGHPDPGAISFALCCEAIADVLEASNNE